MTILLGGVCLFAGFLLGYAFATVIEVDKR